MSNWDGIFPQIWFSSCPAWKHTYFPAFHFVNVFSRWLWPSHLSHFQFDINNGKVSPPSPSYTIYVFIYLSLSPIAIAPLSFHFYFLAISDVCCWFSRIPWLFWLSICCVFKNTSTGFVALSLFSQLFLPFSACLSPSSNPFSSCLSNFNSNYLSC